MIDINCIIIEDEVYARALILSYINKIDNLNFKGLFSEPEEALPILKTGEIDLIFLDIEMPGMRGTEFLRKYDIDKTKVVFTTAYSKYAVDAFELNVVDYLVKPISFDRFQQAVLKVSDAILKSKIVTDTDAYILMKDTHDTVKVFYHEINYILASREYVEFFTLKKRYLLRKSLKSLETELPKDIFIRVHKSYIVNLNKVKSFNIEELKIEDKAIPIGRSYRKVTRDALK